MSIQIINGIQLPAFDVELLTLGKLIAVPFIQHRKEGQVFWLYPSQDLPFGLSAEQYYQPEYLVNAKEVLRISSTLPIQIKTWGRCEYHWRINPENRHLLPKIAQSTIWNLSALEYIFQQHQVLKLLIVRVYRLSQPCVVNVSTESGSFYWPHQSEDVMTIGSESDTPIVSNASFNKRKAFLLAGTISPYKNLETLQFQVEQVSSKKSDVQKLNHDIKQFLGLTSVPPPQQPDPQLDWINDIAALGNRSKEEDNGTSNYEAGTKFEKIVRKSLEFLGFTIDYKHRGGAGGLDLFCSQPYSLIGECKAGKKIPNDTAVQLLNLGTIHLEDKKAFDKSAKIIIGSGKPTEQLKKAAKVHGMAIISPKTLEALVKIHNKYCVDLFKLKDYLIDGQADDEIEKYINQVDQEIRLRSHIVQLVKKYLENADTESAGIDELHAVYVISNPPQPLKREKMYEILIELSSPLIGYLGRKEESDGSDRFYFLRDLQVD